MNQAQTLLGLHRDDLAAAQIATNQTASIYFYSPRPGIASPGFQTLTRDSNYNWVGQGRLSREQAMQFTGSGEQVVTLEGRLYPHMFGGLATMGRLREAAGAGGRFMLSRYYVQTTSDSTESEKSYEYNAQPLGRFGIRRIREGEIRIGNTGLPDVLDFVLELIKVGDDANTDNSEQEFLYYARNAANLAQSFT